MYNEFINEVFADLNEGIPFIVTTMGRALLESQVETGDTPLLFINGIDPETFEVTYGE